MSSDALQLLATWASAGGISCEPIAIRVDAGGNRSVFARRAIAAGESVVVLPRTMMIADADIAGSAVGADARAVAPMLRSPHSALAAWLVLERRDPDSRWRPYLDTLPEGASWIPSLRTDADLAGLTGTRALELITEVRTSIALDHELLADAVTELADMSLADFAWARTIVSSRSFHSVTGGGRALLPIIDMFDHGSPDAVVAETEGYEMRALRDLRAGDEIRWLYGAYSNGSWLARYGFAVAGNPDDEASLRLCSGDDIAVFPVSAKVDARFARALAHARRSRRDDAGALSAIALAAEAGLELLARPVTASGDEAWRRTCAIVRDGEQAVLERVIANARANARAG